MDRAAAAAADVAELLVRATRAGFAVGWAGLAAREGASGVSWITGVQAFAGEPVATDVQYDLASLTKPLATGTLLLLALRDGLAIETPLASILPELARTPWGAVTLFQCATHTAGFPAWAPLYARRGCTRDGYLESLGELAPVAPAGTRVEYSCPGFIALGLALERAAGADLATLFAELVAEPLGLEDELGFAPPEGTPVAAGEQRFVVEEALLSARGIDAVPPPAANGVVPCDDGNARGLGGVGGNAGLFGTAAAVARLAAEYLPGGGELVSADEAALATACQTPGLGQARGIGWQLAASPGCSAGSALPDGAFGHTGFSGTSVWVDPEARVTLVLLGNRLHPGGRTPDLHPMRRRFHALARRVARGGEADGP
jgi:CubicO group peptidase (beta-lactamase class C family)